MEREFHLNGSLVAPFARVGPDDSADGCERPVDAAEPRRSADCA